MNFPIKFGNVHFWAAGAINLIAYTTYIALRDSAEYERTSVEHRLVVVGTSSSRLELGVPCS